MSDRLKSYIQEHKDLLDQKQPPAGLFDKIIGQTNQVKPDQQMPAAKKSSFRLYYAAAALISGAALIAWFLNQQSTTIQSDPVYVQKTEPISRPETTEPITTSQINTQEAEPAILHKNTETTVVNQKSKRIQTQKESQIQLTPVVTAPISKSESTQFAEATEIATGSKQNGTNTLLTEEIKEHDVAAVITETKTESNPAVIPSEESNTSNPASAAPDAARIGQLVQSGFFGWVAKKTDEWTASKVVIAPTKKEDRTVVAFNVNTSYLKLSRSVVLP